MRQTLVLSILIVLWPFIALGDETLTPKPGRDRLLTAVLAQNAGTEITDFLVPYALLAATGKTDVLAVSREPGRIAFWPALEAEPDMDLAAFDAAWPEGADLVIVPAVHDPGDTVLQAWLRQQAAKGAFIASICDGSLLLAASGVLDGHAATGHFYTEKQRRADYPAVRWQANRRYVEDGRILTSSGVSASLPAALRLAERIAGEETALTLAFRYGVPDYGPDHDSTVFAIGPREMWTAARNLVFGWPRTRYAVLGEDEMDETDLAFALDIAARTWASSAGLASSAESLRTRHGLRIYPQMSMKETENAVTIALPGNGTGADIALVRRQTLREDMLKELAARHGPATAAFVATQLEYPQEQ